MSIVVGAGSTHVGKVRPHNEDALLVDVERGLYAVADGMGGHAAGEVASGLAVDIVGEAWRGGELRRQIGAFAAGGDADARRDLLAAVRGAVIAAHLAIATRARERREEAGMGTTFTGFVIAGEHAIFAHVGDCRAYLVRGGKTVQLSEDHTVSARLRAAGLEESGQGDGVLTSAVGIGDARVASFVVPACTGDRLVLCSDGTYGYFESAELGEVAAAAPSPSRAAERLVKMAVARGGEDNASAVVAEVVEGGAADRADRDAAAAATCPLLAPLAGHERLRALRIGVPRAIERGGEVAPSVGAQRMAYVVVEGEVEVGGERRGPGSLLYPAALVAGAAVAGPRARAVEAARVLMLRQQDFGELVEDEPELGVKLYGALASLMATR